MFSFGGVIDTCLLEVGEVQNELQQLVRHFSIPCTAWGRWQFAC